LATNRLSILKFIDVITDRDSKDIEYVFRYLLYADAFDFSASIVGVSLSGVTISIS
jgi:hypothetical protein